VINPLLDYDAAAGVLGCSRSLVSDMALAAEYAAEISGGQRIVADVPPRLRRHLHEGFPLPILIGQRIKRIDPREFADYLKRRKRQNRRIAA
jgi:hypothetical protein